MRIDSVELFHVGLPLRSPRPSPLGLQTRLETVLAAVHGGGQTGWGEASPGNAPLCCAEWAAGAFDVLRNWLAPAVAGREIADANELTKLLGAVVGNQCAKAAIDLAWWDLSARLQNRPLHQFLQKDRGAGPPVAPPAVEVGPTFDRMESIEEFRRLLGEAFDAGFARVKLKFRPGWDIGMVDFVRKEFSAQTIHIDCEGGLHLGQMEMLYRLEDFMLAMIEQPFPAADLVGHAMAQESLRTPICLDEGVASLAQAEMALELHSCRYVNLKPGRVGGLTPALAIHDLCHENCVPCWVGAAPQSALGARSWLALAAQPNCTYPADFFPSDRVLAADVAEPPLPSPDPADGRQRVRLWSEAGIGVSPDAALLEKFSIARARVAPG